MWQETRRPLPPPGSGQTVERFEALADLGARDLCLAKLAEPHHDAAAILAELEVEEPGHDRLWAVWAAEPSYARLRAALDDGGGWRLSGVKAFCSGAAIVTHALVTAAADDGARLFAVDVASGRQSGAIELAAPDWVGVGMRRADTRTLQVLGLPARAVGRPADYVERPGFWHGSVGVAACWLGGARTVASALSVTARARTLDAHGAAHLGAVTAALDAATAQLRAAARQIDRDPFDESGAARRTAQSVRATVAATADQVIARTARALGPAPLAFDGAHAQHVADLHVFIRQHHAERDLADLGRLVAGRSDLT